jgi:hypothetical protein
MSPEFVFCAMATPLAQSRKQSIQRVAFLISPQKYDKIFSRPASCWKHRRVSWKGRYVWPNREDVHALTRPKQDACVF